MVRAGVDEKHSHRLIHLHRQRVIYLAQGFPIERDHVRHPMHHLVQIALQQIGMTRHGLRVELLTLHQDEILSRAPSIFRIDDQRAIHAVGDVQQHRFAAAVI